MNNPIGPETIDEVLDAYFASSPIPNMGVLDEWIEKYPQYKNELTELTFGWIADEHIPMMTADNGEDEEALIQRGMGRIQDLLQAVYAQAPMEPEYQQPITGLLSEVKKLGLPLAQFARDLGLSLPILVELDRRLILYSSLPLELLEQVSTKLQRSLQVIAMFLHQPPTLPQGASYRAEQSPQIGEQVDFFDEIARDPNLDEETRQRWLALKPK